MTILPSETRIAIDGPCSVLELALASGREIPHSCGGMGSCGTCRVIVESDFVSLPKREGVEAEMAEDRGFEPRERLACQLEACDGLVVRLPD